ncbi:FHA domain-containing protein [Myxococcota bacterium]
MPRSASGGGGGSGAAGSVPAPAATAPRGASSTAAAGIAVPPIVDCPQCAHSNPRQNRFCAACGYSLAALALPHVSSSPPPPVAPVSSGPASAVRLTALRADGSEAGSYELPEVASMTVGRDTGAIFAGDSYLSPRHATFTRHGSDVLVRDEGSLNGVYVKLKPHEQHPLEFSDVFRIGQEIIRFEELRGQKPSPDGVVRFGSPATGYIGRLCLVIGRDTTGNAFPVPERGLHCGRERGDILFAEDGYVSGLHCRIARADNGKVYLTDVGSSNGTFLKLRSERTLRSGDILLMGQQLFRVDF